MSTDYLRVIPRDLYNEAKLLKCLGKVALEVHNEMIELIIHFDGSGFLIKQEESDGSIYCDNLRFTDKRGVAIYFSSPLNSKLNWPLYFEMRLYTYPVFDDAGFFTEEFSRAFKFRKSEEEICL